MSNSKTKGTKGSKQTMDTNRFAVKFAYDGTRFSGSQRQLGVRTVEGEIIQCLQENNIITNTKDARFQSASRTDAGVSAIGNVISFTSKNSGKNIINILNSKVTDCWFHGLSIVDPNFNPRHAKKRWYRYHLFNGDKNTKNHPIDFEILKSVLPIFQGEHDFRNFVNPNLKDTKRVLESISASSQGEWIIIDLRANSFLHHQVRRIINPLVQVARGELDLDVIERALAEPGNRLDLGMAPPEPLFLLDVEYDLKFNSDNMIQRRAMERLMKRFLNIQMQKQFFDYLFEKI